MAREGSPDSVPHADGHGGRETVQLKDNGMCVVFEMETSHSEVVALVLSFSAALYTIGADGKLRSVRSGKVYWVPDLPAQLTQSFDDMVFAASSAAVNSISYADTFSMIGQPYYFELPQTIVDVIATEPAGTIAESYRRYVRTVLVPGVQAVAELLKAHAASIE
jgi:hypothetical protein